MKVLMEQEEFDKIVSDARRNGTLSNHHSFVQALYNEAMGYEEKWSSDLPPQLEEKFWTVIRKLRGKEIKK